MTLKIFLQGETLFAFRAGQFLFSIFVADEHVRQKSVLAIKVASADGTMIRTNVVDLSHVGDLVLHHVKLGVTHVA